MTKEEYEHPSSANGINRPKQPDPVGGGSFMEVNMAIRFDFALTFDQ